MASSPHLSAEFLDWAGSKMRDLVEARHHDLVAGLHHLPAFFSLLDATMVEYASQPFARPDVAGQDPPEPLATDSLRERAISFFLTHAAPGGVSRSDVHASLSPRAPSPQELWAMAEIQRLRALTCTTLGIPADTPDADLPGSFAPQQQLLAHSEFESLDESVKSRWHALSSDRQFALKRGEADVISVQDRQLKFFPWFENLVDMEMNARFGGLLMSVTFNGFAVGAENLLVNPYCGQASSYEGATSWHRSRPYRQYVKSLWVDFVNREVEGVTIYILPDLLGVCTAHIGVYRGFLKKFFEEMIRLQCGLDVLDIDAFWLEVAADPTAFVSPDRLPNHIVFANPESMSEDDFRVVYNHVWSCHVDRDGMPPDRRFIYRPSILARYIAQDCAIRLKADL